MNTRVFPAEPHFIGYLRVALDVPRHILFDFLANNVEPDDIGRLVEVPFGPRKQIGVIVEIGSKSAIAPEKLRHVLHIYRDLPAIHPIDMALFRFCADYYQYSLGQTIFNALPPHLRAPRAIKTLENFAWVITDAGKATPVDQLPVRAIVQRRLLTLIQQGVQAEVEILKTWPQARPALRTLMGKGWIRRTLAQQTAAIQQPAFSSVVLNPSQQAAVSAINEAQGRYQSLLLAGITGSGKTEVYLQAIAPLIVQGKQVLVLIPEINLTPQTERIFRSRFAEVPLVILHSNLAPNIRARAWQEAESGHARIVLGTRLAVFTPMPQLALIIVDEEHDVSFKQQEGLRYSARDVAVFRARLANCPVVLGSATPSLESWYNAQNGRYRLLSLPNRAVTGATLPQVRIIDTTREAVREGLSTSLINAIKQRIACGEQSLLFINRRGFAPALVCTQCTWMPECQRCSARLVFHRGEPRHTQSRTRLECHHCGHVEPVPAFCTACGNPDLKPAGQGTQRIENAIDTLFSDARIARIDRDSTRSKGSAEAIFDRAIRGDIDILIGTQMLAKGHDFPSLSLVGVLNADSALFSADFRAAERLFSQLVQVAGRAGRARRPGEVLIQTRFPSHPLYASIATQNYAEFAALQLAERQQAALPPYSFLVLLRAEAQQETTVKKYCAYAVEAGRALNETVVVYDPVPAPLQRKAGFTRLQVLVQASSRQTLHAFLPRWHEKLAAEIPARVRWSIDVDPLEI